MSITYRSLGLLLGLWVWAYHLSAQSKTASYVDGDYRLQISQWTTEDGLPSWHISDLLLDKDGYVWAASEKGLIRFDGRRFTLYTEAEHGLRSNRVGRLAKDVHGRIWLLSALGEDRIVDVFDPLEEVAIPLATYIGTDIPLSFYTHRGFFRQQDTIWILDPLSGQGGRYRGSWEWLLHDTLRPAVNDLKDLPVYYPRPDSLFWVWGTNKHDPLRLVDGSGQAVPYPPFQRRSAYHQLFDEELNFYHWPEPKAAGALDTLFRFAEEGVEAYAPGNYPAIVWSNAIQQGFGRFLHVNKEGFGLAFNNRVLFFFKGEVVLFDHLNEIMATDFSTRITDNIFVTADGAFWVNSPQGLFRMRIQRKLFTVYQHQDNVITSVRGMVVVGDTQLIANTYSGVFQVNLDSKQFSRISVPMRIPNLEVWKEGKEEVWISKTSEEVIRYNLRTKEQRSVPVQILADEYHGYRFHRLRDSTLWLASSVGVLYYDEQEEVFGLHTLRDTTASFWYANEAGLWLGSKYGLFRFDDDGRRKAHFLFTDEEGTERSVHFIHEDEEGVFWLGTSYGLLRWNVEADKYRWYTTEDGLSNNHIHAIFGDNRGFLWLSSNYGLMRFRKADGQVITYLRKDGLPSNEFNFLAFAAGSDGRVFLGGVNGIVSFYPDSIDLFRQAKIPLRVTGVSLYDRNTEAVTKQTAIAREQEIITVPPNINRLAINLTPHYLNDHQMRYEWRLPEQSGAWKTLPVPELVLNNPTYGYYPLEFRAYPLGSIQLGSSLTILLQVQRPFYLRWWFIVLLLFLGIAGVVGYVKWKEWRLKSHNDILQKEVDQQTRELREKLLTIDQQAKELALLDEMKSRFFTNVTHEIRTPLSLILGPVDSLLQEEESPDRRAELARIKRNAIQLRDLSAELLDLARLEAGELGLQEDPVEVEVLIREVFSAFVPLADRKQVVFDLVLGLPKQLTLSLDANKVERILTNLLSNAFKFTPAKGRVLLKGSYEEEVLSLSVKDTGRGIAAADLPYIYDRYYRSSHAERTLTPGTGIGLAICRELAQLMGAQLSVHSIVKRGTSFSLRLRRARLNVVTPNNYLPNPAPAEMPLTLVQKQEDSSLPTPHPDSAKATILLVEDHRDMQDYLLRTLQVHYHILTADNGRQALKRLQQAKVALIITDLMMAEMDGFELLRRVRAADIWIPFILLTARSEAADRMRALELGVDLFLTKPLAVGELLASVENLLRRSKQQYSPPTTEMIDATKVMAPAQKELAQRWLEELDVFLKEELSNPELRIVDLADHLGISERTLRNRIKEYTNMSPKQYLQLKRLDRALVLLKNRQYATINELSFACGFRSAAYFSKVFKVRFGFSPSSYL